MAAHVLSKAELEAPMVFEQLRDSVTAMFKANENGLYITIDHQEQSRSSELMKGVQKNIQVFVQATNPEEVSRPEFENDVTFGLFLRAAAPCTGNLAALEKGSGATPAQKQAALAAIDTGAYLANLEWDALLRIATRIIMTPLNEDLGLPDYTVSDRIIKSSRKDDPVDHGNLIVVTGSAMFQARVTEIMDGDTPVAAAQPFLSTQNKFTPVSGDPDNESSDVYQDFESTP